MIAGRTPTPQLAAEIRIPEPRLIEIDLVNSGTADAPIDRIIVVTWSGARFMAGDAIGGFEIADLTAGSARLAPTGRAPGGRLGPGARRMIGWLRFDGDPEAHVHVEPQEP